MRYLAEQRFAYALVLLAGCQLPNLQEYCYLPCNTTTEIRLTEVEFNEYWRQLERRWPAFFEENCAGFKDLPPSESIRKQLRFIEFPASAHPTCYYLEGGDKVFIGDDKWGSGCVPHEIAHAVCEMTFDGAHWCTDFEHPDYVSNCSNLLESVWRQ